MKVKEESEKPGLKLNIQKIKIMPSSPITPWQIDRENVETVSEFIFFGSNITWCEELEKMRARGEGGDRGWDGWLASLIQWTWVWGNPRR